MERIARAKTIIIGVPDYYCDMSTTGKLEGVLFDQGEQSDCFRMVGNPRYFWGSPAETTSGYAVIQELGAWHIGERGTSTTFYRCTVDWDAPSGTQRSG
jgi:hypothetical protein